jgi:hypothetical protein
MRERDLTSVILACREAPLSNVNPLSVNEALCFVREADNPELAAAYERISELESVLSEVMRVLHEPSNWDRSLLADQFSAEFLDLIDDALDHKVLPSCSA